MDANTHELIFSRERYGMGRLCCCSSCANLLDERYDMRQIQTIRVYSSTSINIFCCSWAWKKCQIIYRDGSVYKPDVRLALYDITRMQDFLQQYYSQGILFVAETEVGTSNTPDGPVTLVRSKEMAEPV